MSRMSRPSSGPSPERRKCAATASRSQAMRRGLIRCSGAIGPAGSHQLSPNASKRATSLAYDARGGHPQNSSGPLALTAPDSATIAARNALNEGVVAALSTSAARSARAFSSLPLPGDPMSRLVMKFGGTSRRQRRPASATSRATSNAKSTRATKSRSSSPRCPARPTNWSRWCQRGGAASRQPQAEYDAVVASGELVTAGLLAIVLRGHGTARPILAGLADPAPHRRRPRRGAHHRASTARAILDGFARERDRGRRRLSGLPRADRPRDDARARRLGHFGGGARRGAATPIGATSTPTSTASTPPIRASCPGRAGSTRSSFEEMLEMASLGAKVLQVRSVEVAMVHKVKLYRAIVVRRSRRSRSSAR